ncbi:aldose epimerase family protein [Maritalea porphyrae]|uniref:Aldose 1-epimerase n=1 Tax=Maritalea porphyrae TaxID=880732 RepID=A0ABQ5UP74_9HYPH|nr:aldose epimerase family protein [Maritalea porphyrae]GLQ17088.1 aldose 1-epimerase [Maritalea porphyrae]
MEEFGQLPNGEPVHRISISGGGLTAQFLTYGTVLQDLRLDGHNKPLVLGFESFAPYLMKSPYFGATAGRCANRIRDGHLEISGNVYQLDRNFLGKHSLHGGALSMGKRVWQIDEVDDHSVQFSIRLVDREMGYPAQLDATARFSLLDNSTFDIVYRASSDGPTLCNLAHHSYFNLSGENTILDHDLAVHANTYLPVDQELIPTGEVRQVANTVFDFRHPKRIALASNYHLLDHNYCVAKSRQPLREVARLSSKTSNVMMKCLTTEPGLQVYDGAKIDIDEPGLVGAKMSAHSGVALEPQIWPDANHHEHFPSAMLQPDEQYEQHTQYIFSKDL